jgi:hypothetical protein
VNTKTGADASGQAPPKEQGKVQAGGVSTSVKGINPGYKPTPAGSKAGS